MLTLYDFRLSGNCYKVRLCLAQLGIPFRTVEVNRIKNETREPEFLAKNPNGKIPLLELESGELIAESNAILCYLAEGTPLFPAERLARARVLQWLFFEQASHMPNIAVPRYWITLLKREKEFEAAIKEKHALGNHALGVMETHLTTQPFFGGPEYSIADISLYAYTHMAEQGKYDLAKFPAVRSWLKRVEEQPGYVPL